MYTMYIYMYICECTYSHMYMYTLKRIHTNRCMNCRMRIMACLQYPQIMTPYIYACIYVYTDIYIHKYTYLQMDTNENMFMSAHTCTHTGEYLRHWC